MRGSPVVLHIRSRGAWRYVLGTIWKDDRNVSLRSGCRKVRIGTLESNGIPGLASEAQGLHSHLHQRF